MRPIGDNVQVKVIAEQEEGATQLIEMQESHKGEVLAIGNKVADPLLKPGAKVLYETCQRAPQAGDLLLLRERDIIAVVG